MDELIDELRELNEDRFGSLSLPSLDDLVIIEEQILISLPAEFKEFLMSVSDVVYGAIEPVTVTDPSMHTYLPEVAATAWNDGLPRTHIPLCEFRGGYYCIEEDGTVSFWHHNEFVEEQWDSVWLWVEDVWLGGHYPELDSDDD